MGFWLFLLICSLLIPIVTIVGGFMMWKHPPKKINGIYGYRTTRSMKNQDTWQFAHLTCGKLWWKTGWIMLPLSVIAMLPCFASSQDIIALVSIVLCLVQCGVLIGTIWPVEWALKQHFHDDGTRKDPSNHA